MNGKLRTQFQSQAHARMVEITKGKTGAERLEIAFNMSRSARTMLGDYLRRKYPYWSEEQVQKELARRMSHGTA